ncbi:MAG: AAA family ATPase [Candidatus Nanosynbacter sp.]|jgi:uncharacterized chromosomal cassette SCCmec type IVc protein CR006|nr:AAA family ATPase [Candidatus Nanosynbacter sp.]
MIGKIDGLTKKSFKNYSTPDNFFKKKNIIFGYNGRGKSSLASGIAERFLIDNDEVGLRYFDTNYVNDSLVMKDSEGKLLKGVKATFSKKDVDIEQKIEEKRSQLVSIDDDKNEIKSEREQLRKRIDSLAKIKKGKVRIQSKNKTMLEVDDIHWEGCPDIDWVLRQYNNDLASAQKIEPDVNKLRVIDGNKDYEDEINRVENLPLPKITYPYINRAETDRLKKILTKTYSDNVPSSEIVSWLEKGISLHDTDADMCLFCQNRSNFSITTIQERVNRYITDEKQKDSKFLEDILGQVSESMKDLKGSIDNKSTLYIFYDKSEIDSIFSLQKELSTLKSLSGKLTKKLSSMNDIIIISPAEIQDIEHLINSLKDRRERLDQIKKDKLKELREKDSNQRVLVNGAIGLAIKEDEDFNNRLNNLKKFEIEVQDKHDKNIKLQNDIKDLESQKSDYGDFMNFLNEVLESLGINIRLDHCKDDEKLYYLRHSNKEDGDLTVKDVSEGEINILALLFFYFELYKDNLQQNSKDEIKLILLDDPISSLDEGNRIYVLELVRHILLEKSKFEQIFIFTHSWNDFCDITYGVQAGDSNGVYGFFEITKDSNSHSSIDIIKKPAISPYKVLFKEIYELHKKEITYKLNDCELYHYANSMRRVFEEFLSFKCGGRTVPTKGNKGPIKDLYTSSLPKNETVGAKFSSNLSAFLSFINILSHHPVKSDEVVQNAKFMMKFIEKVDKFHFDKHKV